MSPLGNAPYNPNPKELVRWTLEAVTGLDYATETRGQMERELLRQLTTVRRVVVVDEAQDLRREAIEHLRYFWDDAQTA